MPVHHDDLLSQQFEQQQKKNYEWKKYMNDHIVLIFDIKAVVTFLYEMPIKGL